MSTYGWEFVFSSERDAQSEALMSRKYDAIVIGSGMGGLTFASLMAQMKGWRVLVLERHFKLGGFTHTFQRPGGYEWDVGIHYVGQMGSGMMGRQIMDLVTGGQVKWNAMPDQFDHYVFPDLAFDFVKGRDNLPNSLLRAFPAEEQALNQYFKDLSKASSWFARFAMADSLPAIAGSALRKLNLWIGKLGLMTTGEYMNTRFQDERLRAILSANWGDYGVPPHESAFAFHALIANHYLDGAWYPEGGAGVIAEAAGDIIRGAGGDLRVNHDVRRILIENGRVVGVEVVLKNGQVERLEAPVVVSDAGAFATFTKLAPGIVKDLAWDGGGFCVATLYLGLDRDPRELGFRGENHWIFGSLDHDAEAAGTARLADGNASSCYLSFPSLKDPKAKRHTAEIIAALPYDLVAKYRDQPWRRRAAEYQALKERVSDALLALVEKHHPGFSGLVSCRELSTPLTSELFSGHARGAIYGYPATPQRFFQSFLRARTKIPGLYLTGADAMAPGVMGAMMGGAIAAGLQFRAAGFPRIVAAAARRQNQPMPITAPILPSKLQNY
jgi:all-trans-retinol 13,14-reductase